MRNWSEHFKRISLESEFGTFLGQQTVAELEDLITAHDNSFQQLDHYFSTTPTSDSDLLNDYAALKARYAAARADAEIVITANNFVFIPASATPAQSQYDEILKALKQSYPDLIVEKGDLQDIVNRSGINMQALPQPKATDIDQKTYVAANAAAQAMPSPVKTLIATVAPGLVPKTADQKSYRSLADMPLWEKGLIGVAIAGVLFITIKVVI